jgi:hypothetical protein
MRVSLLVAVALLMTAVATAQHQHAVPNVINIEGSQELIPDSSPTIRADVAPRQHVRIKPNLLIHRPPRTCSPNFSAA